jgi:hypothetical protein
MARDVFTDLRRCHFCGRPAAIVWDDELLSCRHATCLGLAFAESQRRAEAHGCGAVTIGGLERAPRAAHVVHKSRRRLLA